MLFCDNTGRQRCAIFLLKIMSRKIAQILVLSAFFFTYSCDLTAQTKAAEIMVGAAVHETMPFTKHTGAGAFDNYLTFDVSYAPIKAVFEQVQKYVGASNVLKNRGEAHITVITPPEYNNVLSKALTMNDINEIASAINIQQSKFTVTCLGRAQVLVEGKGEQTYFIVVHSEDLLNLRRAIFKRYVEKGGEPSLWDPAHFYPHITVGFSKQDLHEEGQGVKKGENSCLLSIREQK